MKTLKCSICGKEIKKEGVEVYVENEILDKDKLWCDSVDCFKKANKKPNNAVV